MRHREKHRTDRIGWLRAAVLGANDGIVSTASLGGLSGAMGGAPITKVVVRITFWGALAMVATAAIGALFDVSV